VYLAASMILNSYKRDIRQSYTVNEPEEDFR